MARLELAMAPWSQVISTTTQRIDKRDLEVIFLDLSSAFNSIQHKTLIDLLKNRGADTHFVNLIRNMHEKKPAQMYVQLLAVEQDRCTERYPARRDGQSNLVQSGYGPAA